MHRRWTNIAVAISLLVMTSAALACPMCKESVPASDAQQTASVPAGFNHSIYLLLISFMTVLGGVLTLIVRTIRQTSARHGFPLGASDAQDGPRTGVRGYDETPTS